MSYFVPLLARNEALNQWLKDNPLVLAAIFAVIGAVVIFTGVRNLLTGQATSKWGFRHEGGMALFLGGLRIVAGIVCLCVAFFALVQAIF